jgi:hypothetical protein
MDRCLTVSLVVLICCSCAQSRRGVPSAAGKEQKAAASEQLRPGEFWVSDLGSTAEGAARYLASTGENPGACRFEVLIEKSSKAALVRRSGSDCTTFLAALAKQLAFSGELPRPAHVDRLGASIAILGTHQSRSDEGEIAGGFTSKPPGHWTATKLFLAGGAGEVFMDIDARDGIGEFSIKDEDYATVVVTELAKVLL